MSRARSLAAAAAAAHAQKKANELLPAAIKGLVLGFVGGVIAIAVLVRFVPESTRLDEPSGANVRGKVTASSAVPRR